MNSSYSYGCGSGYVLGVDPGRAWLAAQAASQELGLSVTARHKQLFCMRSGKMHSSDKAIGRYGSGWGSGCGRIYSNGGSEDGGKYICSAGNGGGSGGCRGGSDGNFDGKGGTGSGYGTGSGIGTGSGKGVACGAGRESGTGARFNWMTREDPVS